MQSQLHAASGLVNPNGKQCDDLHNLLSQLPRGARIRGAGEFMTAGEARQLLYFEDLAPGQTYRTGTLSVDADSIKAFAKQFDPQPFHTDERAAEKTFFNGLAASGWHTAALTMRLLVTQGAPLAGGIIGGGMDELRWPRPVRPGDRLHVESEVIETRASKSQPEQGWIKMRTTTLNQNNEPVQIFVGNLIVPRRSPAKSG
jgi:acyl dehydratase